MSTSALTVLMSSGYAAFGTGHVSARVKLAKIGAALCTFAVVVGAFEAARALFMSKAYDSDLVTPSAALIILISGLLLGILCAVPFASQKEREDVHKHAKAGFAVTALAVILIVFFGSLAPRHNAGHEAAEAQNAAFWAKDAARERQSEDDLLLAVANKPLLGRIIGGTPRYEVESLLGKPIESATLDGLTVQPDEFEWCISRYGLKEPAKQVLLKFLRGRVVDAVLVPAGTPVRQFDRYSPRAYHGGASGLGGGMDGK